MTIEAWTGAANTIDNTFGYNDMILTAGNAALPVVARDRVSAADASGANPSAGITDAVAESVALPGDRLFRLPNGGILLRRSVFTDLCLSDSRPDNALALSEPMARALAFFGSATHGSDPSGGRWCSRNVPGTTGTVETPWDISTLAGLRRIEGVLERIRQARAGNLPSDIQPAQAALARELANAIPAAEMTSVATDVRTRREAVEGAGDMFMRHPVLHTLGIAVLFGLGTDMYHVARYALFGGKAPFEGPLSLFGGIRNIIQGIRDFFNRRPPNGGAGGSSGSGGSGNAAPPSVDNPSPNAATRMAALPDVAAGILAFNGADNPGAASVGGVAPVPSVGSPVVNPGIMPVPVIPAPVGVAAPVVAPPVVVPRFVPAL